MRNVRKKAEAAVANAPPKPTPFPKRPPNAFLLFKSINKHKIKESDEPTNNVNAFITKLWKNTPEVINNNKKKRGDEIMMFTCI